MSLEGKLVFIRVNPWRIFFAALAALAVYLFGGRRMEGEEGIKRKVRRTHKAAPHPKPLRDNGLHHTSTPRAISYKPYLSFKPD